MALIPQAVEDRLQRLEDAIAYLEETVALLEEALAPKEIEDDGNANIG